MSSTFPRLQPAHCNEQSLLEHGCDRGVTAQPLLNKIFLAPLQVQPLPATQPASAGHHDSLSSPCHLSEPSQSQVSNCNPPWDSRLPRTL